MHADGRGLPGLLNFGPLRHWTVFVTDFALRRSDVERLDQQISCAPTKLLFARVDSLEQQLRDAGVDHRSDYLSLQLVASKHDSIGQVRSFFTSLPHADMTRLDLPFAGVRFRRSFATHALDVMMNADYDEQDRIANRFFQHLERSVPYSVVVRTKDGTELTIADNAPWFQLAGRMQRSEFRTLPGGEVAYTRDRINGEFTVDGALLPSPEEPAAGRTASRLKGIGSSLSQHPLRLQVREGEVVRVDGDPVVSGPVLRLLDTDDRYRRVTEVGISFNRACSEFIHQWPAASNEGRPGVHVAIGGDPERTDAGERRRPVVHIDFMAATSSVFVNGKPFLHTS